jgi:hypothetical protein
MMQREIMLFPQAGNEEMFSTGGTGCRYKKARSAGVT